MNHHEQNEDLIKTSFCEICGYDLALCNCEALFFPESVDINTEILKLIEKYDEKRITLLHFRRDGKIEGGLEQTKIYENIIKDLIQLKRGK